MAPCAPWGRNEDAMRDSLMSIPRQADRLFRTQQKAAWRVLRLAGTRDDDEEGSWGGLQAPAMTSGASEISSLPRSQGAPQQMNTTIDAVPAGEGK